MSVIKFFRNYLEEKHPHLAVKDWKVDVKVVPVIDIQNQSVKTIIPSEVRENGLCILL